MKRTIISLIAAAGLAFPSPVPAQQVDFVNIPSAFGDSVVVNAKMFIPAGEGPFPAVIVMHGSGGLWRNDNVAAGIMSTHFEEWGELFQAKGWVAIFPDSFTPRGLVDFRSRRPAEDPDVDDSAASPRTVRPRDAFSVLEWLRAQDYVDDDRIAAMGFSHGAESLLVTVTHESIPQAKTAWSTSYLHLNGSTSTITQPPPITVPAAEGFRALVAYYPGCAFYGYFGGSSSTAANLYMPHCPTLLIHGDQDPLYSGSFYPLALQGKSLSHATLINQPDTVYPWTSGGVNETGKNPIWHDLYPGVGHSFDELDPGEEGFGQRQAAAARAEQWLEFYLAAPDESSVAGWESVED